ncbi:ABC transporter permease subunit [Streptomyces sp. TRM66268-LWL]|uniref:ABC transporter permease subunit n=1 Tax=Streptomyces polyasparticus TaxID=2767826 RepID=A0ABR7SDJ2_9ACTN|nr:ABC transporter permease subunit [Streptomyces polyasparticus]MBC9713054.1 ABC transporter permease subunit [Streptomyces polyasparticus]
MTDTQTPPVTPYRSTAVPAGRDGFVQLLRAEWTKLRTVRRWGLTLLGAVLVTVLVSVFAATSSKVQFAGGGDRGPEPTGPGGVRIVDSFRYAHQALPGDGTITVRLAEFRTGEGSTPEWGKAGVLIKKDAAPGASYAALMLTPGHGVRLQNDFVHDRAGSNSPAGEPRWLRLTRDGTTLTGYESADGKEWSEVGAVTVPGLTGTVQVGLFVASPMVDTMDRQFGSVSVSSEPSRSTAVFDDVTVDGGSGDWRHTDVGEQPGGDGQSSGPVGGEGESSESGGRFTLTGSGDIAPAQYNTDLAAMSLSGTQLGLVLIAALGVLFITAEYRRGMIRTTFAASPRRGRVLVAKAVVIGVTAFAAGLVASVASFLIAQPILKANGHKPPRFPELQLTDGPVLRAVLGSAVLLALIAVLALGLGALLRRTAGAVATVVVLFVAPLVLVTTLPIGFAQFLQQFTPLAGFAVQETLTRYDHVATLCLPEEGCYPQGPWIGIGTLLLYAVAVLGLAVWRVRRRDV